MWNQGQSRDDHAARRALQGLAPGVAFDEASGLLVRLPSSQAHQQIGQGNTRNVKPRSSTSSQGATACSLEELAPNLAKRLAIGRNNNDDDDNDKGDGPVLSSRFAKAAIDVSKKRQKPSKYLRHVYPGTSTTTSDEEDGNAYYASRGASICSALLHAMVQIDDRIPEIPMYSYQVSTVSSSNSQLKRKGGPASSTAVPTHTPPSAIVIHRGSFACTATMKLKHSASTTASDGTELGILQATGVGGTKREARHIASAKLLALLFPDCDGMMQVKEAAEAARERYAASKAMKEQSKKYIGVEGLPNNLESPRSKSLAFAMAGANDPQLPPQIAHHFLQLMGRQNNKNKLACNPRSLDVNCCEDDEGYLARQLSRQKQLVDKVDATLQTLNEHDDEGRSLPDEVTVDDVGRTVLRRAGPEDVYWIERLFCNSAKSQSGSYDPMLSPLSVLLMSSQEERSRSGKDSSRLWSSSTIILLLCRAIAPYEDPPLGCAVLTLGFAMQRGRVLRIAQIASEPHLPKERFIECLQSFASCMDYHLEAHAAPHEKTETASPWIRADDQLTILDSFLSYPVDDSEKKMPAKARVDIADASGKESSDDYDALVGKISSQLQSVLEESEDAEESDVCESLAEKRNAKKVQDKPSKRSRVN